MDSQSKYNHSLYMDSPSSNTSFTAGVNYIKYELIYTRPEVTYDGLCLYRGEGWKFKNDFLTLIVIKGRTIILTYYSERIFIIYDL